MQALLYALKIIWQFHHWWKPIVTLCLIAQLVVLVPFNEEISHHQKPSVKEFYDVELFSANKRTYWSTSRRISSGKYRLASSDCSV